MTKVYTMKPLNVEIIDIKFRRPGLTKISFIAAYRDYVRRGVVVYDTNTKKFVTHNRDIEVLAALCVGLQRTSLHKAGLA